MITIELPKGETIKIIGQKSAHLIITNVDGEIFTRTDADRDSQDKGQRTMEAQPERLNVSQSNGVATILPDTHSPIKDYILNTLKEKKQ